MRVFRGFDNLPRFNRPVATIGSFDGVHRGHRVLLDKVCELARARGGESIVLTFDPHPRITLGKAEGLRLLDTAEEKLLHLEQAGVDNVIVIPFTAEFSRLSREEFIANYVVAKTGAESLVVGYNHRFGRDKEGDFAFLTTTGLDIVEVGRQLAEGDKVSSTVIRRTIAEGDLATAWRLMGHPFMVSGRVDAGGRVDIAEREYKLLPPADEYNARTEDNCEFHVVITPDGEVFVDRQMPDDTAIFIEILGKR